MYACNNNINSNTDHVTGYLAEIRWGEHRSASVHPSDQISQTCFAGFALHLMRPDVRMRRRRQKLMCKQMRAKRRAEIYAGKKVRRGEEEEMAVGRPVAVGECFARWPTYIATYTSY